MLNNKTRYYVLYRIAGWMAMESTRTRAKLLGYVHVAGQVDDGELWPVGARK